MSHAEQKWLLWDTELGRPFWAGDVKKSLYPTERAAWTAVVDWIQVRMELWKKADSDNPPDFDCSAIPVSVDVHDDGWITSEDFEISPQETGRS